jgi:polygalacturonase
MWVQHYLACQGVCIEGIRVESTCNANNDGIDISAASQAVAMRQDVPGRAVMVKP